MSGLQIILILLVIFYIVGKNIKPSQKPGKTAAQNSFKRMLKPQQNFDNPMRKAKEHDLCKAATVKSHKIGTLGLEDRENDWLARQLREEAKLKKKILAE